MSGGLIPGGGSGVSGGGGHGFPGTPHDRGVGGPGTPLTSPPPPPIEPPPTGLVDADGGYVLPNPSPLILHGLPHHLATSGNFTVGIHNYSTTFAGESDVHRVFYVTTPGRSVATGVLMHDKVDPSKVYGSLHTPDGNHILVAPAVASQVGSSTLTTQPPLPEGAMLHTKPTPKIPTTARRTAAATGTARAATHEPPRGLAATQPITPLMMPVKVLIDDAAIKKFGSEEEALNRAIIAIAGAQMVLDNTIAPGEVPLGNYLRYVPPTGITVVPTFTGPNATFSDGIEYSWAVSPSGTKEYEITVFVGGGNLVCGLGVQDCGTEAAAGASIAEMNDCLRVAIQANCLTDLILAHEIGHVAGAMHSRAVDRSFGNLDWTRFPQSFATRVWANVTIGSSQIIGFGPVMNYPEVHFLPVYSSMQQTVDWTWKGLILNALPVGHILANFASVLPVVVAEWQRNLFSKQSEAQALAAAPAETSAVSSKTSSKTSAAAMSRETSSPSKKPSRKPTPAKKPTAEPTIKPTAVSSSAPSAAPSEIECPASLGVPTGEITAKSAILMASLFRFEDAIRFSAPSGTDSNGPIILNLQTSEGNPAMQLNVALSAGEKAELRFIDELTAVLIIANADNEIQSMTPLTTNSGEFTGAVELVSKAYVSNIECYGRHGDVEYFLTKPNPNADIFLLPTFQTHAPTAAPTQSPTSFPTRTRRKTPAPTVHTTPTPSAAPTVPAPTSANATHMPTNITTKSEDLPEHVQDTIIEGAVAAGVGAAMMALACAIAHQRLRRNELAAQAAAEATPGTELAVRADPEAPPPPPGQPHHALSPHRPSGSA